ncbi:MAG: PDZ domain-containing protein [Acidimicrobiaceae bacterium]|nr:PDZ domain-containing protein [Acidimicrobiaceae bacterium]MXW74877.1 PDZ domain-containing protein [Acidimicrobiaceae bacterium]MYC40935.1 PDZ domain-containing protein [Acidimicrobiaceae bacterium]MYD06754.1 PDZ domain-containing protein [Acidimicrobiaceae bacterium]MYI58974.1 PDZ domain-containing protein [Acidimicrobiaceae bacterium]
MAGTMTGTMTEVSRSVPMLPQDMEGSTPTDGPTVPARRKRRRPWLRRGLWALLTVIVLVGASLLVPAKTLGQVIPGQALVDKGAAVTRPGWARSVSDRVDINGRLRYRPDGEFLFTTVSVDLDVSVFEWIQSEVNGDFELQPLEHILGDRTPQENRTRNLEMMNRSKDDAITAALEYLGVPVNETGVGFDIVVADGPVDGLLTVDDVIIAVDGVEISSLQSLRDELTRKTPGETGVVTVENADTLEARDVSIVWGEHPQGLEGAYIGIGEIVPRIEDLSLGIDVRIDTGSTGGPSAGLAFTLTIIDWLTEGELTGNQRIAVTGQIFVGGVVGNVGGVGQKAVAARSAGAVAFIVPAGLVDAARAKAGDMRVFGVSTLDEAIQALGELGGDIDDLRLGV